MYATAETYGGYKHLEAASKNIDLWPAWKKEFAGISIKNVKSQADTEKTQQVSLKQSTDK